MDTPKPTPKPTPKKVWVKCRANEKCEGQQAEIVFSHFLEGQIDSDTSGRVIRYKCCSCGQSFHIRQ